MESGTAKAVEATAKATEKALTIIHDTGAYLREVVGDLPKNAVGLLGGDWLGQKRIRNLAIMIRRTEGILQERAVLAVDQLSPNVATELLSGAQDDSREELIELWARLLANALDPGLNNIRRSFIEAVKQMEAVDALVLNFIYGGKYQDIRPGIVNNPDGVIIGISEIAGKVKAPSEDDVRISISHLTTLDFFSRDPQSARWLTTPFGRQFFRACYPEVL
jgi:hypothetical protein